MKFKLKPIHRVLLFGVTAFVLMIVAQLIHEEMAKPEWRKVGEEAGSIMSIDPKQAEIKFRRSHELAAKANDLDSFYVAICWTHAEFLFNQSRYTEAEDMYKHGRDVAHEKQIPSFEAGCLQRISQMEHCRYLHSTIEYPDSKPARDCPEVLKKDADPNARPHELLTDAYYTIANIDLDTGKLDDAKKWLKKAFEEAESSKDPGTIVRVQGLCNFRVLLQDNKGSEALKAAVDTNTAYSSPNLVRYIIHQYREAAREKNKLDARVFPQTLRLFFAKKYADLDSLADKLNADKTTSSRGLSKLDSFYSEFRNMPKQETETFWTTYISGLDQWVKERPESPYAKVALAFGLIDYAWKARGGGYADTVSDEGYKQMQDRLERAQATLNNAKQRLPQWYDAQQKIALGTSWDRNKFDKMVEECRKKYPDHLNAIYEKTYYLQPRWYGSEGEAEQYMESEANKIKGPERDILYAQIAWDLDATAFDDVFEETKVSWPRTKTGLLALIKKDPNDMAPRAELAFMAQRKGETATVNLALKN